MPNMPRPQSAVATESTTRASRAARSLPATGSVAIMARLSTEKYSVNDALGTPKNSDTGVKKMPAHERTSAQGRHVITMHESTMRYA